MIKAIQLVVFPFQTWQRIAVSNAGATTIFFLYFLPMLLLTTGLEALGLVRWGMPAGGFGRIAFVSGDLAQKYALAQALLSILTLFSSALLLQIVIRSFNFPTTFRACFTVYAYGFSPILLMRIAHGFPMLDTWLGWVVGAALAVALLYHGIGLVVRPDQTKGLGIFMLGSMILVVLSGVAQVLSLAVLQGRI